MTRCVLRGVSLVFLCNSNRNDEILALTENAMWHAHILHANMGGTSLSETDVVRFFAFDFDVIVMC